MLSVSLIQRHFETGRFDQLLDALAANGLEMPLPLRVRLSQSPSAAIALGLGRLVELTYGPTPLSRAMARRLLAGQADDGSTEGDPLATAATAAALGRMQAGHPGYDPELALARERALQALAAMQCDPATDAALFDGPIERTRQDRELVAAFILWLLGRDDEFRSAVRFADLVGYLERRERRLDEDAERLWRMARKERRPHAPTSPALAAIAA